MPNWVYNTLSITGDAEQLRKCRNQLNGSYDRPIVSSVFDSSLNEWIDTVSFERIEDPVFSFWNIVRPEDAIMDQYTSTDRPPNKQTGWMAPGLAALTKTDKGDLSNYWYDWNVRNWGTKWDVDEIDFYESDDGTELVYRFDTAWSAPYEAIEFLSKQYPELVFLLYWEEEQCFGAYVRFECGNVDLIDEWDIPNSHHEHSARDIECVCSYADPEHWYADCPTSTKLISIST